MGVRMAGFGGKVPRDNSRKAGRSGRRTAGGSQWNEDNFVVIDVDSVVEIDAPESTGTEFQGYGVPTVISIDDDDDDDDEDDDEMNQDEERDYHEHPAGVPECNSDSDDMLNAANSGDSDDCRVFEENGRAFNLSRCSKSNAVEGSSRNRYGLDSELESDSSDCEILEGSSEELRELWEKAFSRRKPSSSHGHSDGDSGVGSSRRKNTEAPESSNLNVSDEEFVSFSFNVKDDGLGGGGGSANQHMADRFSKSDPKCKEGSFSHEKTPMYEEDDAYFTVRTNTEDYSFFSEECQHSGNSCTCFRNKGKEFHGSSTCFSQDSGDMDWNPLNGAHDDIEQDTGAGTAFPDSTSMHRTSADTGKTTVRNESSVTEGRHSGGRENVIPETCDENGRDWDTGRDNGSQLHKPGTKLDVSNLSEGKEPLGKILDQTEHHKAMDQLCTAGIRVDGVSRDIINDREKLKETDEYKQAVEQEWLARQQQLQIQAEEAQRLRKRRKAESSRALDMEKRQKQRLEEIRETQKKDEEDLNMKDQLRGEIRKELCMLEMTCFDMASVLRRLGIPIGFYPLSNEVRAAYKRALLKFHPDRVLSSDVRQQVEAEEKFKLICRMKDKFNFPS